jgi:hypothetical protein
MMEGVTQEAFPVLEDKVLNELQFIPMERKHAAHPTTPFICPSLCTYIPHLIGFVIYMAYEVLQPTVYQICKVTS